MRSQFMVSIILFGVLISLFMERRKGLESARMSAEKALHKNELYENEYRLQSVMESIADSIYLLDSDYRYLFMNKKHIERLGLTEADYRGRVYSDVHSSEETEEIIDYVDSVFETGEPIRNEYFSRRDNKYFLRTFSALRDSEGKIVAVTVISKDVNDLRETEEKLRSLALADDLTGLYNRRGFFTMAEPLLKLATRHKSRVFLLHADIDNLKEINDVLGNHEGDRAIIDTAQVLKETLRGTDIVARIGGDEFVVMPIAGKKQEADIVVARFKEHITVRNDKGDRPYQLSISVGMSCFDPKNPHSIDEMLKQAEELMYEEKMQKKNDCMQAGGDHAETLDH
jgi:two-component system cell cycle response regulator